MKKVFLLFLTQTFLVLTLQADRISWKTLSTLDSKTGVASEEVKALNGKKVSIPGFIVPLDFSEAREVKEFLVTPSYPGCAHVPPPTPSQTVHVKMAEGKKAEMVWGPIWITGTLKVIEEKKTAYGEASYELIGLSLEEYDLASGGDVLVDQVITGVAPEPEAPKKKSLKKTNEVIGVTQGPSPQAKVSSSRTVLGVMFVGLIATVFAAVVGFSKGSKHKSK